jgi:hypothetical protein
MTPKNRRTSVTETLQLVNLWRWPFTISEKMPITLALLPLPVQANDRSIKQIFTDSEDYWIPFPDG